jgi:hypothetical protein
MMNQCILIHLTVGIPVRVAALADERPVNFYDQLGCGQSDCPQATAI